MTEEIKLRLWLLFDFYGESEPISISIINRDFCKSFSGKTDQDVQNALVWLKKEELIQQDEKDRYYLGVRGSQMIQTMAEKMIFDDNMLAVLSKSSNGPARNFAKDVQQRSTIVDKVKALADAGKANIDYFMDYYQTTKSLFRLGLEFFFGNS